MTPPTPDAILIALLEIRAKIAAIHKQEGVSPWGICAKQRHKAQDIVAAFVDPTWAAEQADGPALRDGVEMSKQIDPACGF